MEPAATSFAYTALSADGRPISGTIDAATPDDARHSLESLRLSVTTLDTAPAARRPRALGAADFQLFNQQLAHLTAAGLPVEHGLRLIAQDVGSGRLGSAIRQVADDLQNGSTLSQAVEKHRGQFPPLYGQMLDAGIRSHNLPGILLNLGRHMELVRRMRSAIWRAASYPLVVLAGLVVVLAMLSRTVLPQLAAIFRDFKTTLPTLTMAVLGLVDAMPLVLAAVAALALLVIAGWFALVRSGKDAAFVERFIMPLPLIGPVLRRSALARWCDALQLAVTAGLDLTTAIELAGEAIGSPGFKFEGRALAADLASGTPATAVPRRLIPPSVAATIGFASHQDELPQALSSLAQMYEQQAQVRLGVMQSVLTPLLIVGIGLLIGIVVVALFMPFISLVGAVSGRTK